MSDQNTSMALLKEVRERTGAGVVDCKKALNESGGDIDKAITFLREKGLAAAAKRAGRAAAQGIVGSYIHAGGKIGVLVEDLGMQIAASQPRYVRRDDIPAEEVEKERAIYRTQTLAEGKPEKVIDRIVDGRLEKYYGENCLLEQSFIRDTAKTVEQLVKEMVARTGENIVVRRFSRFQIGEAGEAAD